jgi:hypothetical protein
MAGRIFIELFVYILPLWGLSKIVIFNFLQLIIPTPQILKFVIWNDDDAITCNCLCILDDIIAPDVIGIDDVVGLDEVIL